MKALPCPRCGNTDVVDTFCANCLRQLHPLLEKVKETTVTFCVMSGDVKFQNAWERMTAQEAIEKAVQKALVPGKEVEIAGIAVEAVELDFLEKPGINRVVDVPVVITGRTAGTKEYSEEYVIPLRVKTTVSTKYAKIGSQYFEGTLQLRNEQEHHIKALQKLVEKQPGLAINKTSDVATGHDYQFTDKQRMRQLALKLFQRFGGLLKENARLITHDKQKSKDVYRLTVLIEFPPFVKGDVVTDGKRLLLVKGFGKKLMFENLDTGKKVEEQYDKDKFTLVPVFKTRVTQVRPEPAILHPETYQQIPVRTLRETHIDEEVRVVQHKKRWYVV